MKKIFITGGDGFVGTTFINQYKNKYDITALCLDESKIKNHVKGVKYVYGNILDKVKLKNYLSKFLPDYILHLAGITQTWFNDPESMFSVNLTGTINLYEAVKSISDKQFFIPKIIYVSSAEVYGYLGTKAIDENQLLNPSSLYAASKAAADRASFCYSQLNRLNIVIARPFAHIGPFQEKGFFVTDMVSQIVEIEKGRQKPIIKVGNLASIRDYLDVRDVASAYNLLLENDTKPGDIFNICSGKKVKVSDILDMLVSYSTKKIKIQTDKSRLRPVDVPLYTGNNSKIVSATGWKPTHKLKDTLLETLEYWRNLG